MRSNSSGESPRLWRREASVQCSRAEGVSRGGAHAAKKSARSQYDQYSRFGIGSRRDAGRERRLGERPMGWQRSVSLGIGICRALDSYRFATSETPINLGRASHKDGMSASSLEIPFHI